MLLKRRVSPNIQSQVEEIILITSPEAKPARVSRDVLLMVSPFMQRLLRLLPPCQPATITLTDIQSDTLEMFEVLMRNPDRDFLEIMSFDKLRKIDELFRMLKIDTDYFKINVTEEITYDNIQNKSSKNEEDTNMIIAKDEIDLKEDVLEMDEVSEEEVKTDDNDVAGEDEIMTFSCQFCEEKELPPDGIIIHLNTHLEQWKDDVVLNCPARSCEKSFEYFNSFGRKMDKRRALEVMEDHLRAKHTRISILSCDLCSKSFFSPMALKYHKRQHSDSTRFYCQTCSHFIRVELREKHLSSCSEDKKVSTKCLFCGKYFSSDNNLQIHKLIHFRNKPFNCDVCQKGFNQKGNLKTHKLKKHK